MHQTTRWMDESRRPDGRVVALAGGVGGARLAHGLQAHLGDRLTVIVNTADDVERHGLLVSPDHDTVMYTLAGIDNREWGWGIAGETFAAAGMLERYGEEAWFRLGDRDLAWVVRSVMELLRAAATSARGNVPGARGDVKRGLCGAGSKDWPAAPQPGPKGSTRPLRPPKGVTS